MRISVYLAGLIAAFAAALPAYVNSSFLAEFVGERYVGLIYIAASAATLILMPLMPKLLRRSPAPFWLLISALVGLGSTLKLAIINYSHPGLVILVFVLYYVAMIFSAFCLDLILEALSKNSHTGQIRGAYWSMVNLAWLASPLFAGNLVNKTQLSAPYLVASLMYGILIIFAFVWLFGKKSKTLIQKEPRAKLWQTLQKVWISNHHGKYENIRLILSVELILNIFYSVMIIYMPVYLNHQLGFTWPQIGIIFTFMLVPFVILDYPLGRLADKYWGEKEILIFGLIMMALATSATSFLTTTSILIWAIVLFLTRVGAASIEIMKETYLFKKINAEDVDILVLSRNTAPLGHLIGPLLATLFLFIFPYHSLFLTLALFIFIIGLPLALRLKDTG